VPPHPAVGVDDDLAAGESRIPHRTTDDEPARGVHVDLRALVLEAFELEHRLDHVLDEVRLHQLVDVDPVRVLGRDEDVVHRHRLVVDVSYGDLRLAVRTQVVQDLGLPDSRETLGEPMREIDGHRHERARLVAGVAEHHALVPGALEIERVIALPMLDLVALVHAHGDVRALFVDRGHDATGLVVETVLRPGVAYLLDGLADDRGDVHVCMRADLPGNDHEPGRHERLARHAHVVGRRLGTRVRHVVLGGELPLTPDDRVQHRIGDLITHLVRVAFRDRLGREHEVARHLVLLRQ
jgi:hypothetical protein